MKTKKMLGILTILTAIFTLSSCNESTNETVDNLSTQPVSIIILDNWQEDITDATIDSDMDISWNDEDIVYYELDEIMNSIEMSEDQADIFKNITKSHNKNILDKIKEIRKLKSAIVKRSNANIEIVRNDFENGLTSQEELEKFINDTNTGIRQLFASSRYLEELLILLNEQRKLYIMTIYNILDKEQQFTWEVLVANNSLVFFGQPE